MLDRSLILGLASLALLAGCGPGNETSSSGTGATGGSAQGGTGGSTSSSSTTSSAPQCPSAVAAPEMVADIVPPGDTSLPARLFTAGCLTYFNVIHPDGTSHLYRTDGTEGGTSKITEQLLDLLTPRALGDLVLFDEEDRLMRSDGTQQGTFALMGGWALPNLLLQAEALGDQLVFAARDDQSGGSGFVDSKYGIEPWVTDGTKDGTRLLADTVPGKDPENGGPIGFTKMGQALYFWTGPANGGQHLHRTDGTPGNADVLAPVDVASPVIDGASPSAAGLSLNGKMFFLGAANQQFGLWVSDSTAAGTKLVLRMDQPSGSSGCKYWPSDAFAMTSLGNEVHVFASPRGVPTGEGGYSFFGPPVECLFASDGTAAGSGLVAELPHMDYTNGSGAPEGLVAAGGQMYFFSLDDAPQGTGKTALFASDGTQASVVKPFDAPSALVRLGDAVYFRASTPETGKELFRAGGSPAVATLVRDIAPGTDGSGSQDLVVIGDRLCFAADDGAHGIEPWTSDGTEAGTQMAADISPGSTSSNPIGFTKLGDVALFTADDGTHGPEIWKM